MQGVHPDRMAGRLDRLSAPARGLQHPELRLELRRVAASGHAFLREFETRGGNVRGAPYKAAGGAAMLAISAGALEIGKRNAEAVQTCLAGHGLRLAATDFGGTSGRTVQLEVPTGRLHVRSVTATSVL